SVGIGLQPINIEKFILGDHFRPEVVTQDEFLYVYWLQADPDRGYRLFEINNQFPKKISLWRRVGLDESAPLIHIFFLTVTTFMLSLAYTFLNVGVLLSGGLFFAFLQRWEVYKKQPLFYQVLLAAASLAVISHLPIPAVSARFFGLIHYGLSFGLATLGTYFILRATEEKGLLIYTGMFILWMVLFQFFSLLPQNILT
ncbi:MAG: hypothetical protein GX335_05000, partial [Firmicutes bacterium]|nr:hypothetical protein [Bacillota bacterium]